MNQEMIMDQIRLFRLRLENSFWAPSNVLSKMDDPISDEQVANQGFDSLLDTYNATDCPVVD